MTSREGILGLPEAEFRELVEEAAKEGGVMQLKTVYAAGYQAGVEDALKALELHPSTLVGRDPAGGEQDERVAIYNLALIKTRQNIEKLKEPSNE